VAEPVDRSTSWPYEDGEPGRFSYARAGHPAGEAVEAELGALDEGRALLFPSGMSAVATVLLTLARPGGTVALAEGSYYGTGVLFRLLEPWGVRLVEFDQAGPPPDDAALVWLEAPANPMLTMPDFEVAAAHPAPVVCDSTIATPLAIRPLELGCDVALHSATKVLAGHDDVLAGAAVVRDDGLHRRLKKMRWATGAVASADTAFLVARGLETLAIRVERQTAGARALAGRLREHPAVRAVRFPDVGCVVSFDVADESAARAVESSTRLIVNATSLGGTTSKLESRHRWEGERCPPGLLRLSVGLEDPDDLWADLDRALRRPGG
jgi:cystathionine gamma-synthase